MTLCSRIAPAFFLLVSSFQLFSGNEDPNQHLTDIQKFMLSMNRVPLNDIGKELIKKYNTATNVLGNYQVSYEYGENKEEHHIEACRASEGAKIMLCLLPSDIQIKILDITEKTHAIIAKEIKSHYAFERYAFWVNMPTTHGLGATVPFDTLLLCSIPQLKSLNRISRFTALNNNEKKLLVTLPQEITDLAMAKNIINSSSFPTDNNILDVEISDMTTLRNNTYGQWTRKLTTAFLHWPSSSAAIPELSQVQNLVFAFAIGIEATTKFSKAFTGNNGNIELTINPNTLCILASYFLAMGTKMLYTQFPRHVLYPQSQNVLNRWFSNPIDTVNNCYPTINAPVHLRSLFTAEKYGKNRNITALIGALGMSILQWYGSNSLLEGLLRQAGLGIFMGLSMAIPIKNGLIHVERAKTTIRTLWEEARSQKNKKSSFCTLV